MIFYYSYFITFYLICFTHIFLPCILLLSGSILRIQLNRESVQRLKTDRSTQSLAYSYKAVYHGKLLSKIVVAHSDRELQDNIICILRFNNNSLVGITRSGGLNLHSPAPCRPHSVR